MHETIYRVFEETNMPKQTQLSLRQQKFVTQYLKHGNATKAALDAGYSKATAEKNAALWTGKNREKCRSKAIWNAIQKARDEIALEHGIQKGMIYKQFKRMIDFDIRNLFDENGYLKPLHKIDEDTAACISAFDVTSRQIGDAENPVIEKITKIKVVDRIAALDSLCKIKGLFKENHTIELSMEKLDSFFAALPESVAEKIKRAVRDRFSRKRS
jgi:phage terminase small subunit